MICIKPVTKLVSVENTANRGGGSCYELTELQNIKEVCLENNLRFHLDGARLFNAIVENKEIQKNMGSYSIAFLCALAKGLGPRWAVFYWATKNL